MKGAVNLKPDLLVQLYLNLFDEIGRNGFKKIILYNAHGGNQAFLNFLTFSSLHRRKPYTLFRVRSITLFDEDDVKMIERETEGRPWGHACEWETSLMMHLQGGDVDLSLVPDEVYQSPEPPEGWHRDSVSVGIEWYAQTPDVYLGNPHKATAERGKRYTEIAVRHLAEIIKSVKENTSVEAWTREYYEKSGL